MHGWGIPYAATLLGLKQVYPGRYEAALTLRLIRNEGVTFSHGVPTLLQMLLSHPDSANTDLSKLKMVVGGSALSQGLCRVALERGIDVFTGYGMSETAPIQTVMHLSSAEVAGDNESQTALRVRAGRPFMLCDVRIVDNDMKPQPHASAELATLSMRSGGCDHASRG